MCTYGDMYTRSEASISSTISEEERPLMVRKKIKIKSEKIMYNYENMVREAGSLPGEYCERHVVGIYVRCAWFVCT